MQIPKALKIRTMCRFRKGISNRFRSYFKVAGSLVVWSIRIAVLRSASIIASTFAPCFRFTLCGEVRTAAKRNAQ